MPERDGDPRLQRPLPLDHRIHALEPAASRIGGTLVGAQCAGNRAEAITTPSRHEQAADRAVRWLTDQLGEDGSFGPDADDLACYYKSPYLLALSGRPREAGRLLDHVRDRFMRGDGDFATADERKSANAAFQEYWAYPNGWIALGSVRSGRVDVAYPAVDYLRAHDAACGGFFTHRRSADADDVVDALTTAHLGLLALSFGDVRRAEQAGGYLTRLLGAQPDLDHGLHLRTDSTGRLVDEFPAEAAAFHLVSRTEPDQAYFMLGYPIAFLARLAELTGDRGHLRAAEGYLGFALSCEGNLRASPASHKVAWGAAVLGRVACAPRGLALAEQITEFLLDMQDAGGAWLPTEPPHTTFDQTAEIAIWLREIDVELSRARP
jgi:hypothetical protein